MSAASAPRKLMAARVTGPSESCAQFSLCRPRTSTSLSPPAVATLRLSPTRKVPAASVPVTTVPAPFTLKARSTHRRTGACASGTGTAARTSSSACRSAAMPSPVGADTGIMGASASGVPASCVRISAVRSTVARSLRVSAIMPCSTPSARKASRWSVDWACHPSSAATTKRTTGAGPTPASILPRNFSWPGTSTKATSAPEGSVVQANPKSMVSPRRFSSSQRSGSISVRARTRVDLPWSTWPAVATTYT